MGDGTLIDLSEIIDELQWGVIVERIKTLSLNPTNYPISYADPVNWGDATKRTRTGEREAIRRAERTKTVSERHGVII